MSRIQKRMLVQILAGFLIGRIDLWGLNPVGIAYFAAGFVQGGSVLPVGIAIILGMITKLPVETAVCAAMIMIVLVLAADLLDKRGVCIKMGHAAIITSFASCIMFLFQIYVMPYSSYELWYAVFSAVLVLTCTRIFDDGIHIILYGRKKDSLSNEELISLVIICALCIFGLPKVVIADISLFDIAVYLMVIVMGYCYGTGGGAVTGAAAGIIMSFCGAATEMIGVMSLLGICSGMLRRQGKVLMLSSFTITAVCLNYILTGEMMEFGTLKAIGIDGILVIFLSDKFLMMSDGNDEGGAGDKSQDIMMHRLKEYSQVFHKLSKTLTAQTDKQYNMSRHDMREMVNDMTSKVCERCEKREGCMGQLSLYKPEIIGVLAASQESGYISPAQMPVEFMKECIHPERFISEANQNLYMAKTIMGFRNRMAESRKAVAGQMKEVGDMVEKLADNMPEMQKFSEDVEEKIIAGLRSKRVMVRDIYAYEKQDGRLEISMEAMTARGRLVTSAEVARVLSSVLDKTICPSDESRKVLGSSMTPFVFEEDTVLHAITGVARMTKEGESVSGDTFSCISLPGGELLLALSDGMGSGSDAFEESQTVIELLEQMAEAGFSQGSAIRLINSMYMNIEDNDSFATLDVVVLNLFKEDCCFLKNGAAATFLRHDSKIIRIEGQTLPVGVVQDIESYVGKIKITKGDYIIMMTDGVSDCFENDEGILEDYLRESRVINPQELAENILDEALRRNDGCVSDDMSVIVTGVWERGKIKQQ